MAGNIFNPGGGVFGGGGGVSTFLALSDVVPTAYTGQAGNAVVVNGGESGLIFGSGPTAPKLGTWDVSETYSALDMVNYQGVIYKCILGSTGDIPSSSPTYWESFGGTPAGADSNIQYNNGGVFGGDALLIWDDVAKKMGIGISPTATFHVAGAQDENAQIAIKAFTGDVGESGVVNIIRSRGTVASPVALTSGDRIGLLAWRGQAQAGDEQMAASIEAFTSEAWDADNNGTYLLYKICKEGENAPSLYMKVDENSQIAVGDSSAIDPSSAFDIAGVGGLAAVLTLKRMDATTSTNEPLGTIRFTSTDGGATSNPQVGATITSEATSAWSSGVCPARIEFSTVPAGSDVLSVRMTIKEDGDVNFTGGIKLGTRASLVAGSMQWTGSNFQGYDGASWIDLDQSGGSSFTPMIKTTTYTASAGDEVYASTAGGIWTLTLPLTPSLGDTVRIVNLDNSFETYNLTINRNGSNIMGVGENMTVNINASFSLKYSDATNGWVIF